MSLIRLVIAALVGVGLAALGNQLCSRPYRCSVLAKEVRSETLHALEIADTPSGKLLARSNLERLSVCSGASLLQGDHYMIVAVNRRILGRFDEAIEGYELALGRDRRPEIYFQIGLTELERGNRDAALRNLTLAASFSRSYLDSIPTELRDQVESAVKVATAKSHG
ncbi:MAG TPA: hypothetical protein VNM92_15420 [Thermoanaerobaculia bacterium]|nr:hypothetical protein [Thermoanaerobaculia bacterium]